MTKLNRRQFIKISAAVGGLALTGGVATKELNLLVDSEQITKTPTYCEICFWKCAGWVYAKDGKPWKIEGNEVDLHSRGRMCTRGTGGLGAYLDSNRLRKP